MNQPRNLEHTTKRRITMAKTVKKLDSKLQKQWQGWSNLSGKAGLKSQTRQEKITTKKRSNKFTTAKFKYTREHVLGHDWLIKIT